MRFWQNRFLKGQTTSDETVLKIFITNQILLHNFALPVFFSTRQYVTSSLITHNFLSILAEFGRFCWCDFGRIDFWRVKGRQMRLSWKFSLLNRYFSTTLLYQILFLMILFFKHIFLSILADFGRFCWCDFVDAILFNWVVKI